MPAEVPLPSGIHSAFQLEVAGTHRERFAQHSDLYGRNVRTKVEACLAVDEEEAAIASAARERYRAGFADALSEFDLIVTPTLPIVPPAQGTDDLDVRTAMTMFTFPLNVVGAPALALPFARTAAALPISAQVISAPGGDALVLAAAALLESALRHTALPKP